MCSCTSWREGWFSLFLNRDLLPTSASSCIDSSSPPSPSSMGALSSSTGANSGLTGTGPIVVTVVPAQVLSGPSSENSTPSIASAGLSTHKSSIHTLRSRRRFLICPVLLFLTKALSSPEVDLISSLCDFGNAQERTLHWASFPDNPAALSLIRWASRRPLTSRTDGILPCASEDLS